jgi:hypothetical protein
MLCYSIVSFVHVQTTRANAHAKESSRGRARGFLFPVPAPAFQNIQSIDRPITSHPTPPHPPRAPCDHPIALIVPTNHFLHTISSMCGFGISPM